MKDEKGISLVIAVWIVFTANWRRSCRGARARKVRKELPERTDQIFRVPLTEEQAEPYFEQSDILAALMRKWERQGWLSEIDQRRVLCCIQNMRMLCNSTFLFDSSFGRG
ncbi:MAG: hypothetical protein ACR2NN_24775 [Bryobacteraceae bacterium]